VFLSVEDYKAVVGSNELGVIEQADATNLQRAEKYAIDEIKSYLRAAEPAKTGIRPYDVDAAFTETEEGAEDERNPQLVMYACDIALYHLVSWLPKKMGYEIREIRYNRALDWLKSVQEGKIILDIPLVPEDDQTDDNSGSIRWGSIGKNTYDW
jgi:phage gp36-like protein